MSSSPQLINQPTSPAKAKANTTTLRLGLILLGLFAVLTVLVQQDRMRMLFRHSMHPSHETDAQRIDNSPHNAFLNVTLGSLGPKGTSRAHYDYYDSLYLTSILYAQNASTVLEVGCASDPFVKHLKWIPDKTCVAPYMVSYSKGKHANSSSSSVVRDIQADFLTWQPITPMYDLVICSQVLEHVEDPTTFLKKLIHTGKTTIVSVPFMWGPCNGCHHLHNHIREDTVLQWAKPHSPIYTAIVQERRGAGTKRLLMVFHNSTNENENQQ